MAPTYRIGQAAELLGVSTDTVRRWIDTGRLRAGRGPSGQRTVEGADLALFAREGVATVKTDRPSSARNQFVGLVTEVSKDTVMAQVELVSGPHRIVSLMSREAADELRLEPGVRAVASVKATQVVVEVPE